MSHRNRYGLSSLAACWKLGDASEVLNKYPGTLVNAPTFGVGPKGTQCIELNGNNQYVNCGDVLELNAVSQFTICFWMRRHVSGLDDYLFEKLIDANHALAIRADFGDEFYLDVRDVANGLNYGRIANYTDYIPTNAWGHVAVVYDGTQVGNAARLVIYMNGAPLGLGFFGTIPAATENLAGQAATIGRDASSLDGELWDFRLYSVPLSRDEILGIIHEPVAIF